MRKQGSHCVVVTAMISIFTALCLQLTDLIVFSNLKGCYRTMFLFGAGKWHTPNKAPCFNEHLTFMSHVFIRSISYIWVLLFSKLGELISIINLLFTKVKKFCKVCVCVYVFMYVGM